MGRSITVGPGALAAHAAGVDAMAAQLVGTNAFDLSAIQASMAAGYGPIGAPFAAAYMAAAANHKMTNEEVVAGLHAHAQSARDSLAQYEETDSEEAAELAADADALDEYADTLEASKHEADKPISLKDEPAPAPPNFGGVNTSQFEHIYGRPPSSESEWKMAQLMDTQTMVGRNNGVPAKVVAGHIKPEPGQGLVRMSLYIPARDVFNMPFNDLGDDRGPNPQFDPRQTRVSLYVDYENGVVAARQNPSIGLNNETQVQNPFVGIEQASDGRLHIQYDAMNPLAPPGSHAAGMSVKGDLTLTPTANGVQVNGQVGDYPSMEIYQDRQGTTTTAYNYQATGSEFGPMENLPKSHPIGEGSTGSIRDYQPGLQWDGPGIPSHNAQVPVPNETMTLAPENAESPPTVTPSVPHSPPATRGEA